MTYTHDRIMVGTFRPTWDEVWNGRRETLVGPYCPKSTHYWGGIVNSGHIRKCWDAGCFDEIVYQELPNGGSK